MKRKIKKKYFSQYKFLKIEQIHMKKTKKDKILFNII